MSLTDEQLLKVYTESFSGDGKTFFAAGLTGLRAIESAATAPLQERIADLERQLEQARSLIANDAHACTFQSLGQYRSALLAALSNTTDGRP